MRNITIFAGGLGTRLNGTESMPKPLVDINGIPLIQRIVEKILSANQFEQIIIIKCKDNYRDYYQDISRQYERMINIKILEENTRTGRTGAIKYVFDSELDLKESFFCNGDTLIEDISNLNYNDCKTNSALRPTVYVANIDKDRNDYKKISINRGGLTSELQNSGYFFITREWFDNSIKYLDQISSVDIDELLFADNNFNIYRNFDSNIYDAGTPDRLEFIRKKFK